MTGGGPGDCILVVNAGSSSLKFSLFRPGEDGTSLALAARGQVDDLGAQPRLEVRDGAGAHLESRELPPESARDVRDAVGIAWGSLRERHPGASLLAVGHRVVHGGAEFSRPALIDDAVLAALEKLVPLAPLHEPRDIAAIDALRATHPRVPQVACFDTAFHRVHPRLADVYALPWEYYEAGVRRYGFHGLSYEYIAGALPAVAPEIARGRVIVAHLGNGASLCALRAGVSVDSTMGFSTLDGVPMGTRPGGLDPGVLLYLLGERRMSHAELERLLYRESGLLGLSGVSHDLRVLLASAEPRARLAVDYYVQRIAREIGGLAAMLGGVDGIVFTAGVGENSSEIRGRVTQACAWLGATLDAEANRRGGPRITAPGSAVSAWVVPTNEELMIARHTLALVRQAAGA
ncbi:MAG TPA: acetate/propionate family kinase [bacterium]